MESTKKYLEAARGVRVILEEALANSDETDDMISIGGKNGPVMQRKKTEELIHTLIEHESIEDQDELMTKIKEYDYPVIICSNNNLLRMRREVTMTKDNCTAPNIICTDALSFST